MAEEENKKEKVKTMKEEFKASGKEVLEKIKKIVKEGNVRRIIVKSDKGNTIIEFPLTVGVVGAALLPIWAAIGTILALVANCTIVVEKEE